MWPSRAPGKGVHGGAKFLAPPYYSQLAAFASVWALFYFCCFFSKQLWVWLSSECFDSVGWQEGHQYSSAVQQVFDILSQCRHPSLVLCSTFECNKATISRSFAESCTIWILLPSVGLPFILPSIISCKGPSCLETWGLKDITSPKKNLTLSVAIPEDSLVGLWVISGNMKTLVDLYISENYRQPKHLHGAWIDDNPRGAYGPYNYGNPWLGWGFKVTGKPRSWHRSRIQLHCGVDGYIDAFRFTSVDIVKQ